MKLNSLTADSDVLCQLSEGSRFSPCAALKKVSSSFVPMRGRHYKMQGALVVPSYSRIRRADGNVKRNANTLIFNDIYQFPGIFIPANRRAKLGLPMFLYIFFICAYCRSRLF